MNIKAILVAIIITLFATQVANAQRKEPPQNRIEIVHGHTLLEGEGQSVTIIDSPGGRCSAEFLTKRILLTATHCVEIDEYSLASAKSMKVKVQRGQDALNAVTIQELGVLTYTMHMSRSFQSGYDLTLILLDQDLVFTKGVTASVINPSVPVTTEGAIFTAIGYGYTDTTQTVSQIPLAAQVEYNGIGDNSRGFELLFNEYEGIPDHGDSGGVIEMTVPNDPQVYLVGNIWGVVSYGKTAKVKDGGPVDFAVVSDLGKYYPWIQAESAKLLALQPILQPEVHLLFIPFASK